MQRGHRRDPGRPSVFGAAVSLLTGVGSDLLRRKPLLITYQGLALASALLALRTAQPLLLGAAAVIGGSGHGAGGAGGPFSPVEQAWLAEEVPPFRRAL